MTYLSFKCLSNSKYQNINRTQVIPVFVQLWNYVTDHCRHFFSLTLFPSGINIAGCWWSTWNGLTSSLLINVHLKFTLESLRHKRSILERKVTAGLRRFFSDNVLVKQALRWGFDLKNKPDVVVYIYNTSAKKKEACESRGIIGNPG